MSKQTAVEWLVEQLNSSAPISRYGHEHISISIPKELIDQAQAMEREQRFQDFKEGFQAAFDSLQGANNLVQSKKFKGGEQ